MNVKAINSSVSFTQKLRTFFVWAGWLAIVIPSIVFSIHSSFSLSAYELEIEKWVYGYINFGSFVVGLIAAIIIMWRKSKEWLGVVVSLMLVTCTSTSDGFAFWSALGIGGEDFNIFISFFLSLFYTLLFSILLLCVLLIFPNGKWVPNWTRWFFVLSLIGIFTLPVYLCITVFLVQGMDDQTQSLFLDKLPELFRLGVLGIGALAQIYRLFVTKDSLERQQLKWIALSLVGMTFFYILYWLKFLFIETNSSSFIDITLFSLMLFFTYSFIITFAISALRYRIWDIDIVINKTLVYSGLTTILGAVGISGAVLFELYAKEYFNQNSPFIGLIIIFPLALLFVPLRDSLQNFVDKHFKPEEIDFGGSIVEFSPEAQLMLTSSDILKILARQIKEQLDVLEVEIYLKHENGSLFLSEPMPDPGAVPYININEKERLILEKGDVLVPVDTSQYSLYLPLTLKRASKPEFLGVIALGLRENGIGYSSSVLKSLKKFGVEAGKVLYIAKLRESTGKNILERLASLERGLVNLKTDLA